MIEKNLKQEYNLYLEYLEKAYSVLEYMMEEMHNYNMNKEECNIENNIDDVEKFFFSIAHLPSRLNSFIDECYSAYPRIESFTSLPLHSPQNKLLVLPLFQDEDIFVDLDKNISNIWKSSKFTNKEDK